MDTAEGDETRPHAETQGTKEEEQEEQEEEEEEEEEQQDDEGDEDSQEKEGAKGGEGSEGGSIRGSDGGVDEEKAAAAVVSSKKVEDGAKKRFHIIKEIVHTETTYVKHLKTVVDVYMTPLRSEEPLQAIMSKEVFKTVFSDLEVILKVNTIIHQQLEERVKDFDNYSTKLGDVFLTIADYLKVYTRYVNNYNDAHYMVKALLAESKEFTSFVQSRRAMPVCEHLDIDDFLIMPVQRIPRYHMLLSDVVKNTWNDHPDYNDLLKAKEKIAEIADFVNEQKRKVENIAKCSEVITSIIGLKDKHRLFSPTRRFVREGKMINIVEGEKKSCYLFLFSDLMIWVNHKKKDNRFKKLQYLSEFEVLHGNHEGSFAIVLKCPTETIMLMGKDDEKTADWYDDLYEHRIDSMEKDNFQQVNKRKTFVHEELKATVSKKKGIESGTKFVSKLSEKLRPQKSLGRDSEDIENDEGKKKGFNLISNLKKAVKEKEKHGSIDGGEPQRGSQKEELCAPPSASPSIEEIMKRARSLTATREAKAAQGALPSTVPPRPRPPLKSTASMPTIPTRAQRVPEKETNGPIKSNPTPNHPPLQRALTSVPTRVPVKTPLPLRTRPSDALATSGGQEKGLTSEQPKRPPRLDVPAKAVRGFVSPPPPNDVGTTRRRSPSNFTPPAQPVLPPPTKFAAPAAPTTPKPSSPTPTVQPASPTPRAQPPRNLTSPPPVANTKTAHVVPKKALPPIPPEEPLPLTLDAKPSPVAPRGGSGRALPTPPTRITTPAPVLSPQLPDVTSPQRPKPPPQSMKPSHRGSRGSIDDTGLPDAKVVEDQDSAPQGRQRSATMHH